MRRQNASAITVLDAAAHVVPRVAAPWMGVLWLTALPLRFLQVYFIAQLVRLDRPAHYLYYLWNLAAWVFAALVLSLYGRAVFVRACRFARGDSEGLGMAPFKVPLSDFIPYVYTALIIELAFYFSVIISIIPPLIVVVPFPVMFAGVAAAASQGIAGPKVIRAPLEVLKIASNWKPLLGSTLLFTLIIFFVYINFFALILLLLYLSAPLFGEDFPRWQYMFEPLWGNFPLVPKHGLVLGLMLIGTILIIEPFWLAANVELVQIARARRSGEDLRLWFNQLKSRSKTS